MGGPGSGRREGNPAENRKKKAKQTSIEFRCWDWQKDIITADAEAAGMDRSTYILEKLEVNMYALFYDRGADVYRLSRAYSEKSLSPNGPDTWQNLAPGPHYNFTGDEFNSLREAEAECARRNAEANPS